MQHTLGFLTPVQQKQQAAKGGVDDSWLQADKSKRAYVLSKETKEKIASSHELYSKAIKVRPQGSMYVGSRAMANTKLVQWIEEPLLKCSYITTACLGSAGTSAKHVPKADTKCDFPLLNGTHERYSGVASKR